MFRKEFKVKGKMVSGQIIGNWSKESEFALKLAELETLTLGEGDLDRLIDEFVEIRNKITVLNTEHNEKLW